ncbi:hypothetical protein FQR65_LT02426 [Abscondita terminalis]|nr:hypothetical protein FQR65_LT02426 [Abscondita terminalis]
MVLSHAYSLHEHLHDGITEAMSNYNNNSQFKLRIDKLQMKFQCCGSKHFDEWYNITWYDSNLMKHRFNNKSTPFSCCSMTSMSTCVHYGVESTSPVYRYTRDLNFSISPFGCTTALTDKKKSVGWDIFGRITVLSFLEFTIAIVLRLYQSAHSIEYRFKDVNRKYIAWIFGSRVPEDTEPGVGDISQ